MTNPIHEIGETAEHEKVLQHCRARSSLNKDQRIETMECQLGKMLILSPAGRFQRLKPTATMEVMRMHASEKSSQLQNLLRWVNEVDGEERAFAIAVLAEILKDRSKRDRQTVAVVLVGFLNDSSESVREAALLALTDFIDALPTDREWPEKLVKLRRLLDRRAAASESAFWARMFKKVSAMIPNGTTSTLVAAAVMQLC